MTIMDQDNYSKDDIIGFLKKIPVSDIGLSVKVSKILTDSGLNTLYDLCETDFLKFRSGIKGLGEVGQKEVLARMNQLGLKFRWNDDGPYSRLFSNKWRENCNTDYEDIDVSKILDLVMRWENGND
ncbi:hypothetical protein [Butyrivibrio sp. FCS006]|uniref:hypothetical protein n=1 Tax=Butyrivibrio sp. FCS006 TaxID=1280684 RepID=UPI000406C5F8|nr:hypothetical protein [Butyrivibrio sp. FCS006]